MHLTTKRRFVCRSIAMLLLLSPTVLISSSSAGDAPVSVASNVLQNPEHNAFTSSGPEPPLAVAWRRKFPGPVSNLVTANGRVFMTSGTDGWSGSTLHALDAINGRRLWGPVDLGGFASNTPSRNLISYHRGRVLVTSPNGVIHAYREHDGKLLWHTRRRNRYYQQELLAAHGGVFTRVYREPWSTGAEVDAFRVHDGSHRWRATTHNYMLTVGEGRVYAVDSCARADAFAINSGKRIWQRETECSGGPTTPPVYSASRLFLVNDHPQRTSVILDSSSGGEVGTFVSDVPPVILDDVRLVREDGTVRAEQVWTSSTHSKASIPSNRAPIWSFSADTELAGPLLVVGRTVYTGARNGTLFAIDLKSGTLKSKVDVGVSPDSMPWGGLVSGSRALLVHGGRKVVALRSSGSNSSRPLQRRAAPPLVRGKRVARSIATQFHMNSAHDLALAGRTPAPPLSVRWSRTFENHVSYPIVVGNRLFVTTKGTQESPARLHGHSLRTGARLWKPRGISRKGYDCSFYGHPVFSRRTLVIVDACGVIWAYSPRVGRMLWGRVLPHSVGGAIALYFDGAPSVRNGVIYTTGSFKGEIAYAFDVSKKKLLWRRGIATASQSTPAVTRRGVFFSNVCHHLRLALRTGRTIWDSQGGCSGSSGHTPLVKNGLVFIRDSSLGNEVRRVKGGRRTAEFSAKALPVVDGNTAYVVAAGRLRAVHRQSRTVRWTFKGDGQLTTAPVLVGRYLYVGSRTGRIYAVRIGSGKAAWSRDLGTAIGPIEEWNSDLPRTEMAVARGVLVVPTSNRLFVLEAAR